MFPFAHSIKRGVLESSVMKGTPVSEKSYAKISDLYRSITIFNDTFVLPKFSMNIANNPDYIVFHSTTLMPFVKVDSPYDNSSPEQTLSQTTEIYNASIFEDQIIIVKFTFFIFQVINF